MKLCFSILALAATVKAQDEKYLRRKVSTEINLLAECRSECLWNVIFF